MSYEDWLFYSLLTVFVAGLVGIVPPLVILAWKAALL